MCYRSEHTCASQARQQGSLVVTREGSCAAVPGLVAPCVVTKAMQARDSTQQSQQLSPVCSTVRALHNAHCSHLTQPLPPRCPRGFCGRPPPCAHRQVEAESSIGADNVGHKLLQKMGWQQGKGIGAKGDGRTAPVAPGASAAAAGNNLGLGAEAHGAVKEDDDPFEAYRKRMMLGYKWVLLLCSVFFLFVFALCSGLFLGPGVVCGFCAGRAILPC